MDPDTPRQPVFNIPPVLLAVLALLGGIHLVREFLSPMVDADILARFAFVPGRLTLAFDPGGVADRLAGFDPQDPDTALRMQAAQFFLGDGSPQPWTALTYALLHANWAHVGLNAIWLLAFGSPIARRIGPVRCIAFLIVGALAGAVAHYVVFPTDLQPLIGASASVSACMAGALRFVFRPAEPLSLKGVGPDAAVDHRPLLSVRAMLRDRRAVAFLVVWFVTNFVTGIGSVAMGLSDAPIAWQAHIGGFLFGLLAFPLFDPAAPPAPADAGEDVPAGQAPPPAPTSDL